MKKTNIILSALLTASVFTASSAWAAEESASPAPFADTANHWAKINVQKLVEAKVVEGSLHGKFEPARSITRAEMAAMIVRALKLPLEESGAASFKDVPAGAWYSSSVAAAAKAGIIKGYADGTYLPNSSVTREELSAFIIRAYDHASIATRVTEQSKQQLLSKFKDSDQIVSAHEEVAAAINAKVITGVAPDTLAPKQQASRAEAAVVVSKFLGALK